ncbi:MAG TPA: DUF2007 domain-containing protein [Thermoanaerobaculia bacterium]|nr:DUF2007 domain-containing protein [Thermoanaerobaculia bacterium]
MTPNRSSGGDDWLELTVVTEDAEARLIEGWLENEGVECQLESLMFTQEPVQFGLLGGVRIHVRAADHGRATALLEQLKVASADAPDEEDEEHGPQGDAPPRNGES